MRSIAELTTAITTIVSVCTRILTLIYNRSRLSMIQNDLQKGINKTTLSALIWAALILALGHLAILLRAAQNVGRPQ